jgi:acyl-CoA synthetase (AMP-forming)/AMP-acid ligase II
VCPLCELGVYSRVACPTECLAVAPCGHGFHFGCIMRSVHINGATCSVCTASIDALQLANRNNDSVTTFYVNTRLSETVTEQREATLDSQSRAPCSTLRPSLAGAEMRAAATVTYSAFVVPFLLQALRETGGVGMTMPAVQRSALDAMPTQVPEWGGMVEEFINIAGLRTPVQRAALLGGLVRTPTGGLYFEAGVQEQWMRLFRHLDFGVTFDMSAFYWMGRYSPARNEQVR